MNRATAIIYIIGLTLASALLLAADADAYPACPCTPTCNSSCTCCATGAQPVHAIPVAFYSDTSCTGNITTATKLPDFNLGNSLPTTSPSVSALVTIPPTVCPNGQTCLTGGTCGTCTWSTCSGCTATCNSSCTGTQSDGCGNTQSCTIPALSDGASCTTTGGAAGTCSGGVCTATCTSSTTNGVQCSGGNLYYNDSCGNVDTTNLYDSCSATGQQQGCVNGHTKCITTYPTYDLGRGGTYTPYLSCVTGAVNCLNTGQGDPGGTLSEGETMNANGFCIYNGYYDSLSHSNLGARCLRCHFLPDVCYNGTGDFHNFSNWSTCGIPTTGCRRCRGFNEITCE